MFAGASLHKLFDMRGRIVFQEQVKQVGGCIRVATRAVSMFIDDLEMAADITKAIRWEARKNLFSKAYGAQPGAVEINTHLREVVF